MIKLVVRFDGRLVQSGEFDQERIVLGRGSDCDITIDNLGVSRHHAEIVRDGKIYIVRDLGSSNGTFVGERKVSAHNLNDGDKIFIGKHSITFENKKTLPTMQEFAAPSGAATEEGVGDRTVQMDGLAAEALSRSLRERLAAYVSTRDGSGVLRNYPLRKPFYFFGTATICEFQLSGWGIGHKHAMIVRDELGFRFLGLTKKHPQVGAKPIEDHRLKDGDILKIGRYEFTFRVGSPSAT